MYGYLISLIFPESFRSRWGLDESELRSIEFLKLRLNKVSNQQGPKVLVQMPKDYFCLTLFYFAISRLCPSTIKGLWHQNIISSRRYESLGSLRYFGRCIAHFLDQHKWEKMYVPLGVHTVFNLELGIWDQLLNRMRARSIVSTLNTKQNLLDLRLDGIACGDLIYDTYLRYRIQPTIDLRDDYLCYLVAKTLDAQQAAKHIFKDGQFDIFLTSYSSYVQHGIPVRVALMYGVEVYSAGNLSQFLKRLSLEDSLHTTEHWSYKERFSKLEDQDLARSQAKKMLETRFAGGLDKATSYMKSSAFSNSEDSMPSDIEGVVFLHDFFDSPHCHRSMLFPDFIDWARYTLGVIEEHQLPFAVKPHPNQLPESIEVVAKLQKEFPHVRWLPSTISNRVIFQLGIRCGISVYGTILHELAYYGIAALAAGDHPHRAFDIAITPNTIQEYRRYLIQFKELHLGDNVKDEVLSFYYMHNIYKNEGLDFDFDRWDFRRIGPNNSERLEAFFKAYPEFPGLESKSK